jgi:hypothetical protein
MTSGVFSEEKFVGKARPKLKAERRQPLSLSDYHCHPMLPKSFGSTPIVSVAAFAILLCVTSPSHAQALGQKQTTAKGNLVAIHSISWPGPMSSVSADVEVCAGANAPANTFAFPSFFQVHFADGGAIASYGSKKQPTLERTPLKPKQCARGWLDFAVTSGQKPTVIRYHELSADNKVIEWPVK